MGKGRKTAPVEATWEVGKLAGLWEQDHVLRSRGRACASLTRRPSAKSKAVPSLQAIQQNGDLLLHLARLWAPMIGKLYKGLPARRFYVNEFLGWQVLEWRSLMGFPDGDIKVYVDQRGIRRLFSLAVRRRGSARKRRDCVVEELFSVLNKHWELQNKKKDAEQEDTNEDAEVDACLLSDT